MKYADGILSSDIHLRDTVPECRTDNFLAAQSRKLKFISDLQRKHDCPVYVAGDIFNHWKPSPQLLGMALRELPNNIITIPGQHDLPAHSIENLERSGIDVLAAANKITLLCPQSQLDIRRKDFFISGFPWGTELESCESPDISIALIHYLVYKGEEPFPGAANVGGTGKAVIKKMAGYDLILCGDNHQCFTERVGNTLLVNPGSMMRTTAAQADFKPSVFLWYADTNEVEQVFLPIEKDVVSREHIDVKKEKDERIEAYVTMLNKRTDITLSFEANMDKKCAACKVRTPVRNLIYEAMGR